MYSIDEILYGVRRPTFAIRELNRVLTPDTTAGVDVFEQDWDNLIVLDACRYDYFADRCDLNGDLQKRMSKGSATREWVEANFDRQLYDTVYVSANGWFLQLGFDENLHAYVSLHEEEYRNDVGTVPPSLVTDEATDAAAEYPEKRLVVHYVQPHAPYMGPTGREYFGDVRGMNIYDMLREIDDPKRRKIEKLRMAYRENLDLVLDEVSTLLETLDGKTVVTADHGELLGERRLTHPLRDYGHPTEIRVPELVDVPWLVCESDSRRRIVPERPRGERTESMAEVESLLEDLGYQ
jgi:hypothetical protein